MFILFVTVVHLFGWTNLKGTSDISFLILVKGLYTKCFSSTDLCIEILWPMERRKLRVGEKLWEWGKWVEIIYLTHTARMKVPLLVRSDTPCASYHLGPIHEHTSIHPIPRIIQDQLTHSCINPNTQTFPLLLDWKSENRTKDKCLWQ